MKTLALIGSVTWCLAFAGCGPHIQPHEPAPPATSINLRLGLIGSGSLPPLATKTHECFTEPGACGYPDPGYSTVGYVGNCSSLTPEGEIEPSVEGERIEHKNITGTVLIAAANVVMDNDCITTNGHGSIEDGIAAVRVEFTGTNFKIENSTIKGKNQTTESVPVALANDSAAVNISANKVVTENCTECVHGSVSLFNSYIVANGIIEGEHYEDVYCNDTTFVAEHDVLFNPHEQTANILCDTNGGGGGVAQNHVTITKSLLAGGGYLMYPQSGSSSVGESTMNIKRDHFARCVGRPLTETGGGNHHCTPDGDEHGYFPFGGSYGPSAYKYCPPVAGQIWELNYWDNNLEPALCE